LKLKALLPGGRDFRFLWAGGLVSGIGNSLTSFALMAIIYAVKGTTTSIAALYVVAMLPSLLVSLPAGVVIDRASRRQVMIASDLVRAVLVLAFLLTDTPLIVYALYAAIALANQFFEPARNALLPRVVEPDRYVAANALMLFNFEVARVVGPALAGWLVSMWGPGLVFGVDSLTFLASAAAVACIARRPAADLGKKTGSWRRMRRGLADLAASPPVRYCTLLNLGAWLVAGASPVVVYTFGLEALHVGNAGAGVLLSAMGAGMMVGSAALGTCRSPSDKWGPMAASLVLSGAFMLLMALFGGFYWAMFCRFMLGMTWVVYRSASAALLQEVVPDDLRGRAFAAYNASLILAMIVSYLALGPLTDAWGPRPTILAMGSWLAATGVAGAAARRTIAPLATPPLDRRVVPRQVARQDGGHAGLRRRCDEGRLCATARRGQRPDAPRRFHGQPRRLRRESQKREDAPRRHSSSCS